MAATKGKLPFYSFAKGLVKQVNEVNAPPDSLSEASNVVINRDGSIEQRGGLQVQPNIKTQCLRIDDYSNKENDAGKKVPSIASDVTSSFIWKPDGSTERSILVSQLGSDVVITPKQYGTGTTIDLTQYSAEFSASYFKSTICTYTNKGSTLVIAHPAIRPIQVIYNQALNTYDVTLIRVRTRDFDGVTNYDNPYDTANVIREEAARGALVEFTGGTPNLFYKYNILNAGWSLTHITDFDTNISSTPSMADVATAGIVENPTAVGSKFTVDYSIYNQTIFDAFGDARGANGNSVYDVTNSAYYDAYSPTPSSVTASLNVSLLVYQATGIAVENANELYLTYAVVPSPLPAIGTILEFTHGGWTDELSGRFYSGTVPVRVTSWPDGSGGPRIGVKIPEGTNLKELLGTGDLVGGTFTNMFANLSGLSQGGSTVTNLTGLAVDTQPYYLVSDSSFKSVEHWGGRLWFAGVEPILNNNALDNFVDADANVANKQRLESQYKLDKTAARLFYSRSATDDFGKCYSAADPTSFENSDIVDTDGGYITIAGILNIVELKSYKNALLVFAQNGVWAIVQGETGFKPNDYVLRKLTNSGCTAAGSVIEAGDLVVYMSDDGLYAVNQDQVSAEPTAVKISEAIDDYLLESIDRTSITGAYDSREQRVYLQAVPAGTSSTASRERSKVFCFNVQTGAFFEQDLPVFDYTDDSDPLYVDRAIAIPTSPIYWENTLGVVYLTGGHAIVTPGTYKFAYQFQVYNPIEGKTNDELTPLALLDTVGESASTQEFSWTVADNAEGGSQSSAAGGEWYEYNPSLAEIAYISAPNTVQTVISDLSLVVDGELQTGGSAVSVTVTDNNAVATLGTLIMKNYTNDTVTLRFEPDTPTPGLDFGTVSNFVMSTDKEVIFNLRGTDLTSAIDRVIRTNDPINSLLEDYDQDETPILSSLASQALIIDDPTTRKQSPMVHTFMRKRDDSSLTMQGRMEWYESGDSGKWSKTKDVYRAVNVKDYRDTVITKSKIKGVGNAIKLRFNCPTGSTFKLLGFAAQLTSVSED